MVSNSSVEKRYIRSVSDALSCSPKAKKRIVTQIRDSVADFMMRNPDADVTMIQAHFGTPQEIAASYVNEQDTSVLVNKIRIKKKVVVIVAGAMTAILLLWAGVVAWVAIDAKKQTDRQIEVIIEE